jgi:hypothetical protein
MTFGCWSHGQTHNILYGGRWWLPPSPGCGESCEFVFTRDLSVHQKCSNFALTNLLFDLCKPVWIIEPLVVRPNPIPELQHFPLPPKCCERRSVPNSFSFCYLHLGLTIESIKELGGASIKVHIHKFCRYGKIGQNSKVHYLLAIHNFDLIFSFLEGWLW